jgi:hypothetical protein
MLFTYIPKQFDVARYNFWYNKMLWKPKQFDADRYMLFKLGDGYKLMRRSLINLFLWIPVSTLPIPP